QVLTKACLECLKWPGGTSVAVNLSSMQFSRSNVPALVRDVLAATNVSASRLELEITESTLLQDTIRTRYDLHLLERLGVKISLTALVPPTRASATCTAFRFTRSRSTNRSFGDLSMTSAE